MDFTTTKSKKLDDLYVKLKKVEESVEAAKEALQKLQADEKKEMYKNIPGIEGLFDGENLVDTDGKKHKVPVNYAAKSKLVYGDKLKLIIEGDNQVFKQVEKVDRKEVSGILSKKEGRWYMLTDAGSYQISDTAAEFSDCQKHDEVIGLIPEGNLQAPYAALEENVSALERSGEKKEPVKIKSKPKLKAKSKKKTTNPKKEPKKDTKPKEIKKDSVESISLGSKEKQPIEKEEKGGIEDDDLL